MDTKSQSSLWTKYAVGVVLVAIYMTAAFFYQPAPKAEAAGTWSNVTPAGMDLNNGSCGNYGTQTIVVDPARPSNLYVNVNCQGIWKSTDYGASWTGPINTGTNGATSIDCAGGIAIAPGSAGNPPTIYESCIRGAGTGFQRSTDGGVNWTKFSIGLVAGREDYYPPVVDPYDGNHILMAGHEMNALVQSFNGGQTWSSINMSSGMNQSGGTAMLYFVNTGSSATTRNTWLYTAQGTGGSIGTWRTTNGGTSWTKVDNTEHPHGNGQIYQPDNNGVVYMAGLYSAGGWGVVRSTDYGATWTHVGSSTSSGVIFGTPNFIYADYAWACGCAVDPNFQTAAQPGITGWSSMATPSGMSDGPAQAAVTFNGTNYIIVTANWQAGVWRYVETASGNPAPTVNISASPSTISSGNSSTITWSSTSATSCTASGAWSGSMSTSGTQSVSPTTTSTYTLSCTGTGGTTVQSATVTVGTPDTTPPTVSISSPSSGSTVSTTVAVTANTSDNVGVAGVQFKVDGTNIGAEDTSSPFAVNWDSTGVANGTHSLTAVARDTSGNTATSASVSVTVTNTAPSGYVVYDDAIRNSWINSSWATVNLTDTGAIHSGANSIGVTYNGFQGLYFTRSTPQSTSGYTGVDFYVNGGANASPVISLMIRDSAGNPGPTLFLSNYCTISANTWTHCTVPLSSLLSGIGTSITAIDFQENAGTNLVKMYFDDIILAGSGTPDTTVPTVSVSAPTSGSTVSGTTTVSATASDNVGVVGVQFKLDGANLGAESLSSPYSISWDSTTASNGSHSITAVARDASGNTSTSAAVSVTVNNVSVPTVTISASPGNVTSGSSSTLTWSSTNATSCTASNGWTGAKATSGSQSVTVSATTTYTLACTGTGGTTTQSAVVVVGAAISGLHVSGNQILNASNQVVHLRGADKSGTEYMCLSGGGIFDGPATQTDVDNMKAWQINIVRIPVNEDCWLGINGVAASTSGTNYQTAITNYVNLLSSNGIAPIIDLQWAAPGTTLSNQLTPMPDADHAPSFWTSVANTYKSNGMVIFDLFNEPFPDNNADTTAAWTCLKNGGTCSGVTYQAAGMQTLVNTIRGTGSTNLIMVPGVQFTNTLTQWLTYKPTDPANNLTASWHSYANQICITQSCWDSVIKPVMNSVPLIVGEIGENDCQHIYIDPLMNWLDTNGGNYVAWAWNTYDCSSFPSLISAFDGTPTSFGVGFRDHLLTLAGLTPPTPPPIPMFSSTNPFGINVGSSQSYTASDGTIYYPDVTATGLALSMQFFTPYSTTQTFSGTSDSTLYQTGRTGNWGIWTINVPNGNYQVTLGIAPTGAFSASPAAGNYNAGEFGQDQYVQSQKVGTCIWSTYSGNNISPVSATSCPATPTLPAPTVNQVTTVTYNISVFNQQLVIEPAASFGGGRTTILNSIKVAQVGAGLPTVSISASPATISSGASTLTWSSTNATSCTASGAWSGTKATSGTQSVSPTTTSTYTLACTGTGGTTTQSTTVTVSASNTLPAGTFDGLKADGVTLHGWSYDPDIPSGSNAIQIFVNGPAGTGTLIYSATTNVARADVNSNFGITGNHGFEFVIPSQYQDGVAHNYYAYGIDLNDSSKSTLLTGSPKSATIDGVAPTITITTPANNATVSGSSQAVSATAADNVGVVGVQFKLDGNNLNAEDTASPYSTTWNTTTAANGSHTLTATARDAAGNSTTSTAITVTVNNVTSDTTPPSVPTGLNATPASPTQVNLSWTASTDNVGVVGYKVFRNGTQVATPTTVSYQDSGLSPSSAYSYTVASTDAAGNVSAQSTASVANTPAALDTTAPTVSVTAPANNATVSATTTLTATANDNVGVVGVQFKRDGINLGAEDTTSPYSFAWDTTATTNGAHTITAVARDAAGNTTTSSVVNITVNNVVVPPSDTSAPSVPAGLSASTVSSSQINLSWTASTDNVGIAGYRVFRNGTQIATAIVTTTYQDTGLTASTSYSYTVLAYDAANNLSNQSTSASATTQAAVVTPTPTPTPSPTPTPTPSPSPTPSPTPSPSPSPTPLPVASYPSGLIFKYATNPTVYILNNGVANPITDWTVYLNNVPPTRPIATLPDSVVFPIGSVVGLRSGTLIKASNNATVYLIVDNQKRAFSSSKEFTSNGYKFNMVYTINDLNLVNSIQTTTSPFIRPVGTWFKYSNNSTVYYLNSYRQKRAFTSWNILKLWVDDPKHVITIPNSETYPDGPIVTLPNGIPVKGSSSTVYMVDSDKLRALTSTALGNYGFKLTDVITLSDNDLQVNPIGDPVQ